jgi:hypothetical protein
VARRRLAAGLVIVALYLVAAGLTFSTHLLPGAPVLDDGTPVAPYQWVSPPPDRARDNRPPSPGAGSVPLPLQGAPSVSTPEGQAQLLFETTSVPLAAGQSAVSVTMVPLDPTSVGPPPAGQSYYSNAYRIAAVYEPSGSPVTGLSVTVALVYSSANADRLRRWNGSSWDGLQTTPVPQSLLAYAPATSLGVFAVTGPAGGASAAQPSALRALLAALAIFAVLVGVVVAVVRRGRR